MSVDFRQTNEADSFIFKFDGVPPFSYQIKAPPGIIGTDMLNGKKVENKQVSPTALRITFRHAGNSTDKTGFNIGDDIIDRLSIVQDNNALLLDFILKRYTCFEIRRGSNSVEVDFYKDNRKISWQVAPGLTFSTWRESLPGGETSWVYVLEAAKTMKFFPFFGGGAEKEGLATVSEMLERSNGLAAVNSCYFGKKGLLYSTAVSNGKIISTSPYERTSIGFDGSGSAVIGVCDFNGVVTMGGREFKVDSVNRYGNKENIVIFNSSFYSDEVETVPETYVKYVVKNGKVVSAATTGKTAIPGSDGFVVAVGKEPVLSVGDSVSAKLFLDAKWARCRNVTGAGPCLIKNGKIDVMSKAEKFKDDIAVGRAPRTAIGVRKDGTVVLVVVDGRRPDSSGMSLDELAAFMLKLEAVEALNFDGGGSSEMVVEGNIVNRPADGQERKVGSSLIIGPADTAR